MADSVRIGAWCRIGTARSVTADIGHLGVLGLRAGDRGEDCLFNFFPRYIPVLQHLDASHYGSLGELVARADYGGFEHFYQCFLLQPLRFKKVANTSRFLDEHGEHDDLPFDLRMPPFFVFGVQKHELVFFRGVLVFEYRRQRAIVT